MERLLNFAIAILEQNKSTREVFFSSLPLPTTAQTKGVSEEESMYLELHKIHVVTLPVKKMS